jgi:cell division protein FtsI (penicillin-binding protein 3)
VILVRVFVALGLVVAIAFAIFYQALSLQLNEKDKWEAVSAKQSTRMATVKAVRGNILASDGRILATSVSKYELRWDFNLPGLKDRLPQKIDTLALLFSQNIKDSRYKKTKDQWKNSMKKWFNSGNGYQLVAKDVDYELIKQMKTWPLIKRGKYKSGLITHETTKRVRPFEGLARRTIGDLRGLNKIGVENYYDSFLRGKNGKRLEQRTQSGDWKPLTDTEDSKQQNGYNIITTLDIEMQDVAEQALRRTMIENNAKTGTVVLMEVKTGAVKAIANLTKNRNGDYVDIDDYSINDASDPGSTFKLISYMALLEDGFVKPEDSVDINWGKAQFYDRTMVDAGIPSRTKYTVQECFERSSNVGIATLIQKHYGSNPAKFIARIKQTGVEKVTGIDLVGERKPRITTPEDGSWSGISLPWMSIGYENAITPLGMLSVYNAVANNGKYMRPYLVSEIQSRGKTIHKYEPVVKEEKICSDATLAKLRKMLEGVVQNGTAKNLKNLSFSIAGKTGTAQIATRKGYLKNAHKASFAGYFPADKPKYACIVVINEPRNGAYYGSLVAGPVFGEIADKIYAHSMDIHPIANLKRTSQTPIVKNGYRQDIKDVLNKLGISSNTASREDSESEWVRSTKKDKYLLLSRQDYASNKIPNVYGMGLRDALFLLEERGLKVEVRGYGKVSSQSLLAGANIIKGSNILINLRP